jgi:hypothetical protein
MDTTPLMSHIMNNDQKFTHLKEQIKNKEQQQLRNSANLNALTKENPFLEQVRENYKQIHELAERIKEEQIQSLEILAEYIKENSKGKKNYELKRIQNEIKKIKKNIMEDI